MELETLLRSVLRSVPMLGEDAAIQLIIGVVRRDTGSRGGRPKKDAEKPLTNHLQTTSEPLAPLPAEEGDQDPDPVGKEEDPEKISECGELSGQADLEAVDPPFLTFPLLGRGRWHLRKSRLERYRAAYPKLDVEDFCRRALSWAEDNPSKRKTAKGMPKFLNGWLSREMDKLAANAGKRPNGLHVGHVRITGDEDYGPEGEQQL